MYVQNKANIVWFEQGLTRSRHLATVT